MNAAHPQVIVCADNNSFVDRAADLLAQAAQEAIAARGRFTLALTGGSVAEKVYTHLARPEQAERIDWSKTRLFMGDERFVPADDTRSNYGMVRRTLLSGRAPQASTIFPVRTDLPTPFDAADAYAALLATEWKGAGGAGLPRFDLILLGMGEDGHVASLFPGALAVEEKKKWVTWSPPGTLPPPVNRITLTFPVLNAARSVLFIVTGEKKAPVVRDVLEKNPAPENRPAAGVCPKDGTVTWLLDSAAAADLSR